MTEQNAVTFNQPAFRTWVNLHSRDGGPGAGTYSEVFTTGYQRNSGEAGWLVEAALACARDSVLADGTAVWSYGPGVGAVRVWAIADPEGGQNGIVGEVIADNVVLSLGHIPDNELVRVETPMLPGYEAAELALAGLADRVVAVVEQFRAAVRAVGDVEVVDAEIVEDDSAYERAAAAVDYDTNHPGHPTHW